jgi:hypothetical protein
MEEDFVLTFLWAAPLVVGPSSAGLAGRRYLDREATRNISKPSLLSAFLDLSPTYLPIRFACFIA